MQIEIANLVHESLVEGHGIREVIAVQGCPHRCEGCHSPHTWEFGQGTRIAIEELAEFVLAYRHCDGVTFSGGEPFAQAKELAVLGSLLKQERPNWDIWVYSGWSYRQLKGQALIDINKAKLLDLTDVLVDGPYIDKERDLSLAFRGSKNQQIIELKERPVSGICSNPQPRIVHKHWEKQIF